MKILQGVTGQAGQPNALSSGFRDMGYESASCSIADHKFGYASDIELRLPTEASFENSMSMVLSAVGDYDVFHFHGRSFYAKWPQLEFPAFHDIVLLKLLGKKVFFHFRGQELRLAEQFKANNPFHYVDDPVAGKMFRKMPDSSKKLMLAALEGLCDGIFVVDPELQTYAPNATVVNRVLTGKEWKFVGVGDNRVPIVVHAPSRRAVKGTKSIIDASNELKAEGVNHELRLVEDLNHNEAIEIYRNADIIIDQLRIGWYGVFATEAMALGKPVIAYMRDDIWEDHKEKCPIVNASPLNIKEKLRELLNSSEKRSTISVKSREYFDLTHSTESVCNLLINQYKRDYNRPCVEGYMKLINHQNSSLRSSHTPTNLEILVNSIKHDGIAETLKRIKNRITR